MVEFWSAPTSKHAYTLAIVSVIVTIIAALTGIMFYEVTGSSLCLAYGLENLVDLFSSIIVLWRFFVPSKLTEDLERQLHAREHRASTAISITLAMLGIGLSAASIDDYVGGMKQAAMSHGVFLFISLFSIIIFGILTAIKFKYAIYLDSPSLYKDGICSLIGTITSAALFFNTLIVSRNRNLWWFDPTVAVCCGIGAFCIGFHALFVAFYVEETPIFSLHWWMVSEEQIDLAANMKEGTNDVEITRKNEEGTLT